MANFKNLAGAYDGVLDASSPQPVFNRPTALTVDRRRYPTSCCAPREIFIADTGNGAIRKVTRIINFEAEYYAAKVETVARGFLAPRGLAFAPDGSLYVSDASANNLSRIAPGGSGFSSVPG